MPFQSFRLLWKSWLRKYKLLSSSNEWRIGFPNGPYTFLSGRCVHLDNVISGVARVGGALSPFVFWSGAAHTSFSKVVESVSSKRVKPQSPLRNLQVFSLPLLVRFLSLAECPGHVCFICVGFQVCLQGCATAYVLHIICCMQWTGLQEVSECEGSHTLPARLWNVTWLCLPREWGSGILLICVVTGTLLYDTVVW